MRYISTSTLTAKDTTRGKQQTSRQVPVYLQPGWLFAVGVRRGTSLVAFDI